MTTTFKTIAASGLTDMEASTYANIIYNSMPSHFADYFDTEDDSIMAFMRSFSADDTVTVLDFYINKVREYCHLLSCTASIVFDGKANDDLKTWWQFAKNGDTVARAWDAYMSLPSDVIKPFENQWKQEVTTASTPKGKSRGAALLAEMKKQQKAAKSS